MASSARSPADPGFGIYVHWPYCAQKCPYCDFNSHVRHEGWDEAAFLGAYRRELATVAERVGRRRVDSVFFGGGTPSLMQAATVAGILDEVADLFDVDPACEVTLEANPGSVEAGRFLGYKAAGVNRVSLGVQALRDEALRGLGRVHSVAEAKAALDIAATCFDRVSFDLIYARSGQTVDEWRTELGEALNMACGAGHLSAYQLTIEPDTPFARWHAAGRLAVPDGDEAHAFYEVTRELTEAAGLPAYETSNHARPGEESRHNLIYWRYGAYAGVGPGAHGRLDVDDSRIATSTERQPEAWVERVRAIGHGFTDEIVLAPAEMADELILMGLRLREGLNLDRLSELCGVVVNAAMVEQLAADGLVALRRDDAGGQWLRAIGDGTLLIDALVYKLAGSLEPAGNVFDPPQPDRAVS